MTESELEFMGKVRTNIKMKLQTKVQFKTLKYFIDGIMEHFGYEYDEKTEQYRRKEGESD